MTGAMSSIQNVPPSEPPDLKLGDIIIAVMGTTGSGKTTFVNLFADYQLEVGHGLESCTQSVQVVPCTLPDGKKIYLADTPGFDDTFRSESEVLREVALWLNMAHKTHIKLTGIIYLHRILDVRFGSSGIRNLRMFKKLCGDDGLGSVVLATTMWETTSREIGEQREAELQQQSVFWRRMIEQGSKVFRHDAGRTSGMKIIQYLIDRKRPVTLDIQREMVDQNLQLGQTGAGAEVASEVEKAKQYYDKRLKDLETQLAEALAKQDHDRKEEIEEMDVEFESKIMRGQEELRRILADSEQLYGETGRRLADASLHHESFILTAGMSPNQRIFRLTKERLVDDIKALLLQPNIDINAGDTNELTVLHYAARNGKRDAIELLLKEGADINAKDKYGRTPLMMAAELSEATGQEVAELLLSAKDIDITEADSFGSTALIYAAISGNYEMMRLLLKSEKVDINHARYGGGTALIMAVEYKREKIIRLLLHYGALRGAKDFRGRTAQELAQSTEGSMGRRILEIFGEFPDTLQDERRSDKLELPLSGSLPRWSPQLLWKFVESHAIASKRITSVDLSPLPKDTLRKEVISVVERVKQLMWEPARETHMPGLDHEDRNLDKPWIWIHVPCNNILWVRWAIQHLPASYKMVNGTNLIGVIDEAFDELKRSPQCRQVHCTTKEHVLSIVMPYLVFETENLLGGRTEEILKKIGLWEPADNKRYKVQERKHILQIPQTLDQSHFATDRLPEARDRDQVTFRYTEAAKLLDDRFRKAQLLMVNQVWLWKVENLVVTAFPDPWTLQVNHLFESLNDLNQLSIEGFVERMLRQCVLLSDEPGDRGWRESEPWPSIFAKSTTSVAQVETDRYKMFSDYIRGVSQSNRFGREQSKEEAELDRELKALYDIYPETEGLRQARDIRDELKMIERVIDNQEAVINRWRWATKNNRMKGFAFTERRDTLRKIDKEAENVERRFNQLLDLKQKQGSLNFARDADKRDKENEKQSQLLLAFTIITVIFTPLNFVAAFMAIPTNEYPHRESNVNWRWWQSFLGMLVSEVVVVLPAAWFWRKSAHEGGEKNTAAWFWRKSMHGSGERNTAATNPSKPPVDSKLSNKGDGVV